ncbi:hypothetical protein PHYBLDRAFT_65275 [Phycomyces blakesleeanus NRRL 1555(-)]|uniref:Uncharacterized protein n=1 Tax=Phycomyces blakesleeanus (strain ATCC 8743b / DSM 1359 / FGSC 10004 / NBRC 33097 / NRRL 1555) TaxID=763407 RepID=A0A167MGU8_PHYB8|nr:hypothetical protein PHYBLDRAFT_65275 [Phycomyces blakesleeanus NRRL 1555(-)]OAD72804.1 hypothetical protein PHYBLDRAFT_65275 [Phycomyces blakesleeanus NRRL 1555(-)]|eukprot:XP_018290844.1 hypothetical protein PHYBLDRAFT_65275 [Phycomyces blakesleeanus NRRL 1555(-)]
MHCSIQMGTPQKQNFKDGHTVSDKKRSLFLTEYVPKRGNRYRKNDDGTSVALGRESILAYVKAISDISNTQNALGLNTNGVVRGPLARNFLDTLGKDKKKVKRRKMYFEE